MFALTADQVDSRHGRDRAGDALRIIAATAGDRLVLPADRTAGDEVQALTTDAATAIGIVLALLRTGQWSVGLGIGAVREPLPDVTRAVGGDAFVAARGAVERAKKQPTRFAAGGADGATGLVQPLVDLLLATRERRTVEGWELFDLLESGMTQAAAAQRLGVSPQAVSNRAQAAGIRLDAAARPALATLLHIVDEGAA